MMSRLVEEVGFYHGGDELYKLSQVPGVWHQQCLKEASTTGASLGVCDRPAGGLCAWLIVLTGSRA